MLDLPIIMDVEASGFGRGSYPIEIGFVNQLGQPWCSLICPEDDWLHWDEDAAQVHRISRHTLLQRGNSVRYVAEQLNTLLHDQCVYTDGWTQDYVWLARLFESAGIVQQFKLDDLRYRLSLQQQQCWHQTKLLVQNELNLERHRASSDALVIQMTWAHTLLQPQMHEPE